MRSIVGMLCVAAIAACAQPPILSNDDSVVPGSIGVLVRQQPKTVVVTALRKDGPAARTGVRIGDIVLRYNGEALTSARQFYRLVLDSRPGSLARIELLRDGAMRVLEVPVEQLDTMPRV
jgi:S1-C subfamily serine protease